MKTNKVTPLGDVQRVYPANRKSVHGRRCIPWKSAPITRTALVMIWLIAAQWMEPTGEGLNRKFRDAGVTPDRIYLELMRLMPTLADWIARRYGITLTAKVVGQRFYMMFLEGCSRGESRAVSMSVEHPQQHAALRVIHPAVEALFKRGTPVTETEAYLAGKGPTK